MTRRFLMWSGGALVCLLAYGVLASQIQDPWPGGRARAETAQLATGASSEKAIADLRVRVDKLEKELRTTRRRGVFLGLACAHPEPARVAEEEVAVLRGLVATRLETWRRIHRLQVSGARGGEAAKEASARFHFWLAMARLAWAEKQDKHVLHHLEQAIRSADLMVAATQAAYESGGAFDYGTGSPFLEALLEAQAAAAQVRLVYCLAGGTLPESMWKQRGPWILPPGDMPGDLPENELPEKTSPNEFPGFPEPPVPPTTLRS